MQNGFFDKYTGLQFQNLICYWSL